MGTLDMIVLEGDYSLCQLEAGAIVPSWATASAFYSVTNTADELSIVCESTAVPFGVKQDGDWKLLKMAGVFDLSLTGITARFSSALANAGINICVIATYNTDYIMVKSSKLSIAITALAAAGFNVQQKNHHYELQR